MAYKLETEEIELALDWFGAAYRNIVEGGGPQYLESKEVEMAKRLNNMLPDNKRKNWIADL